jgi:transposase
MPNPYSADLRERVLLADEAGLPPAVVAQRFGVGLATVYLWRWQARAGATLRQAAWRRAGTRERHGGRGDLAGAGGGAE